MHHSTTLMCHCEERSDVAISGRHLQPVQAIADRMQYCRGGDSRARRCTCARNRLLLKWQTPKVCHCEEAAGRRDALSAKREEVPLGCNLGKAPPIYTECRRTQSLPNLTVAALSERLVRDNSTVGGRWCATALP